MEQLHGVFRCGCCNELCEDLREFETSVMVLGKSVLVREMIDIFQLPQGWSIKTNDGICLLCLERLEYSYHFYYAILLTTTTDGNNFTNEQTPAEETISVKCSICDASFATKLELEKHSKIHHPQSNLHFYYCQACKKSFKTNRGMLQHSKIYHDAHETYCCHICERQFITKTNYLNHMRHHKDQVCGFCSSGWIGETKLLEHVRTAHSDRLFVCRFCNRKERLNKCLNRHLRTAHQQKSNPYVCGHCGHDSYSYESYEMLTDHLHKDHREDDGNVHEKDSYGTLLNDTLFGKELELPDTDMIGKEQEQFLHHFSLIRSAHEKKEFARPLEPRIDQRMILEDFLDEAFENDEIWNKYIENGEEYLIDDYDIYLKGIESSTEQEPCMYSCPQCQRGFEKQNHLTVHLAEDHDVASLVCNDCGGSFTRLSDYRTHRREHLKDNVRFREMEEALSLVQCKSRGYSMHEEDSGCTFICNLCDRTFQRKHNLEKHRCRFSDRRPQQEQSSAVDRIEDGIEEAELQQSPDAKQDVIYCMLCDRRFSSTSGLKYHLKRHTGNKAFACLYCEKRFTANSNLNAHIRNVHSKRKNFRCTECNESFATKDHLNKHQRSRHRQERAFVCGECGKSYLQRSHLNEHVAACHREDRYLCNVCNGSYVSKSSLKRHQHKKHHIAQEENT
ncbi:gastrula zinc finger protein xFG20-1-like isoform X2 [Anopheles moucheti]|uniref:gastrula zinc finger protein xFG20-1-like isoform X2 n=1 Tax=Anopheles moucheti TaxID=186751 RepID=UPI0022F0E3FD|nr:gastrula zinc finger protein xFG20-1-like isoform X2 [Anopheles moucheti]